MNITVVVLTDKNKDTSKLLKQLKFADEILIICDAKEKKYQAKKNVNIYYRPLANDFSKQRNFALKKAKYDWVLFIDSDEEVSKALATEVREVIENSKYDGYYIKRIDNWKGKTLKFGEFLDSYLLRLGRKSKGQWKRSVHETWGIKNSGKLKNYLIHYPHPTVHKFVSKINIYSGIHASENAKSKKATIFHIILFPWAKFVFNYIFKRGFLDGTHGFVVAMMMSFHSYLAWSKQWTQE